MTSSLPQESHPEKNASFWTFSKSGPNKSELSGIFDTRYHPTIFTDSQLWTSPPPCLENIQKETGFSLG